MLNSSLFRSSLAVCLVTCSQSPGAEPVSYNRDIRPILSDNCYKCHGPDGNQRQSGLRLDVESVIDQKLESGKTVITPGNENESELLHRITTTDTEERMPPANSGKSLTQGQINLLRRWIAEGAQWQGHWSFQKLQRPPVPPVVRKNWVQNPIDSFVLARLERAGLAPSPEAPREALIRRASWDLTGLPPTLAEIDAFLADARPGAYERVVDRLLQSQRYGEHMARFWLDAARYGDTHGLHLDNERSIWPYRDWVIRAFNSNMPFDRFTIEQLAGDLLADSQLSQKVATGFNRCNVTTSEGGAIADEYRFKYGVDRVETTATVWLGLTMGCAVCHEHKFDPFTQKEFYQLLAYFNSLTERAMDGNALLPPPSVKAPTEEQLKRISTLKQSITDSRRSIAMLVAKTKYKDPGPSKKPKASGPRRVVWIDDTTPVGAKLEASGGGARKWQFVSKGSHPVHSGRKSTFRKASGLGQHFFTGAKAGLRVSAGDRLFAWVYLDVVDAPQQIMLQFNDGNWEHRAYWGRDLIAWGKPKTSSRRRIGDLPERGKWTRLEVSVELVGLKPGAVINGWAFTQHGGTLHWDTAGIVTSTGQGPPLFDSLLAWQTAELARKSPTVPQALLASLKTPFDQRSPQQQQQVLEYFLEHAYRGTHQAIETFRKAIQSATDSITALEKSAPSTLVMQDMKTPRPTFVLKRGQYDQPDKTQPVQPGVPSALGTLPPDASGNRLGLAQWLVDQDNPLTARVTVNRFWQQYFGVGLVKTSEDFGSQGDWPSHPALLDWLATEFIGNGWDIRAFHRSIVLSATYRQSSRFREQGQAIDPENRLLWRGARFRLDAEMLRDGVLAVSGLLVNKVGGKSVRPYQPDGLWKAVGYSGSNTVRFVQDHGGGLFRRSLYTFWKRTAAPPTMLTFDAPSRESCTVRRARTNTPLQALLLLNDVQFVEAARGLAQQLLSQPGTERQRLTRGFRMVTARKPRADELAILQQTLQLHRREYRNNLEAANKLLAIGESKRDLTLDAGEHAAWTLLSNLLLNLDETLTKN